MKFSLHNRQKGVALIMALLVISLVTIMLSGLAGHQQRDIHRSSLLIHYEQSLHYALGVESWALGLLAKDIRSNDYDDFNDDWNYPLEPQQVRGGFVEGKIHDLQGRLNLNNLRENPQANQSLIKSLLIKLNQDSRLAARITDWIDVNEDVFFPDGAESAFYMSKTNPFKSANQPIFDLSELILIQPENYEFSEKLFEHISALPVSTKININTASAAVISASLPGMDISQAKSITNELKIQGLEKTGQIKSHPLLSPYKNHLDKFDVKSSFFLLETRASFDDIQTHLYSLIFRDNKGSVKVIERKLIPYYELLGDQSLLNNQS